MATAIVGVENKEGLRLLLSEIGDRVETALSRYITREKVEQLALIAASRQPQLFECTRVSLAQAIMRAGQIGIDFSGAIPNSAWIIPYYNKKTKQLEAQFQVGYGGLTEIALRDPNTISIKTHVVYDCDKWEYSEGLKPVLSHVPMPRTGGEEIVAFYAVCTTKDTAIFEWMWRSDVEEIRQASKLANGVPWTRYFSEMGRKTVLRRLIKWIPLNSDDKTIVALAVEQEDQSSGVDVGYEVQKPEDGKMGFGGKTTTTYSPEAISVDMGVADNGQYLEQSKEEARQALGEEIPLAQGEQADENQDFDF